MRFFLVLAGVNIACFLPLYAMNLREQANPFAFLKDSGYVSRATLRLLFARKRFTDPFRINFDFTVLMLLTGYLGDSVGWVAGAVALVLTLSFVAILYASVMHALFKRPPSLASDLVLLQTGWSIAYRNRYLILVIAIAALAVLIIAACLTTRVLFASFPATSPMPAVVALLLVLPCVYHWRSSTYSDFFWRVTYSPTLHFLRHLEYGRKTTRLLRKSPEYFDSLNEFKALNLQHGPNIIVLCIESYGSLLFKDPSLHRAIASTTTEFDAQLDKAGYQIASNLSEAPIFAGGSWLSYTTATYGALFDDADFHEGVFSQDSNFGSYESLFHVLERNGYSNNLLCPLGGVGTRHFDWGSLDRCFRPKRKITFDDLNYTGNEHNYFVFNDLYAAPDQYALNFAYESAREQTGAPFSLFYCTINSHYPWTSRLTIVDDWRRLNDARNTESHAAPTTDVREGYVRCIRYQIDNIMRFVLNNADDDLLVVAFGDHQPPFITPEVMGKHTPVHIISRRTELVDVFMQHGFVRGLDVAGQVAGRTIEPIKHQGILSLLMRGMSAGYGSDPSLTVHYRPDGVDLRHGL